ncbi:MAG: hypothetical protein U0703_04705 [Anaerolineae bacterium]
MLRDDARRASVVADGEIVRLQDRGLVDALAGRRDSSGVTAATLVPSLEGEAQAWRRRVFGLALTLTHQTLPLRVSAGLVSPHRIRTGFFKLC